MSEETKSPETEEATEEVVDEKEKESKKEKKHKEALLELENKNAQLAAQVKHWQNKYYEAYADMDNLKKRMDKDHENVLKYRGQGFLEALLPVFDNFYACFKFKPEDPTLAAYCKGFEMIYNQMLTALENEGVKEILPKVGDAFDAKTMQAVDTVDGEENDKVVKVSFKGYMLKDRLIRPAMVVVSKIPQPKEENKDDENHQEKGE